MITGEVDDGGLVEKFVSIDAEINVLTSQAVWRAGARMWTQVRANASTASHPDRASRNRGHIPGTGPGPNVGTGDYRRSIKHAKGRDGSGPFSVVSSNAVQAFRLEYGFTGTDSLGRSYRQPPYPHWEPAAVKADEFLKEEMARALRLALRTLRGL